MPVSFIVSTKLCLSDSCTCLVEGGDLTFFKVQRVDGTAMPYIDVLACGNGQWGGLGNALYTNAQSSPLRAKNVSGLYECKDLSTLEPHFCPITLSVRT